MRGPLRWLDYQMDNRPFVTAVVVMILVVTPGFLRIQQIADDAQKTAEAFAAAEARKDVEQIEQGVIACQTRNTFQQNVRDKFDRFNDAIELLLLEGQTDPAGVERTEAFVEQLRTAVATDPIDEDRDCTGDNVFDEADYLP